MIEIMEGVSSLIVFIPDFLDEFAELRYRNLVFLKVIELIENRPDNPNFLFRIRFEDIKLKRIELLIFLWTCNEITWLWFDHSLIPDQHFRNWAHTFIHTNRRKKDSIR